MLLTALEKACPLTVATTSSTSLQRSNARAISS